MVVFNFGRVHFATICGNAYQQIKCPWPNRHMDVAAVNYFSASFKAEFLLGYY